MESSKPIDILLVEDNPGDVRLTVEAFKDGHVLNTLHHVKDGVDALAFLNNEGEFANSPKPDIVLLDLNLPRMKGQDVLSHMRQDDRFKRIPVVALTTSNAKDDIDRCYALGANAYIVKPVEFDKFIQVVNTFQQFWLKVVTLPD